jgi:hypothetical protein
MEAATTPQAAPATASTAPVEPKPSKSKKIFIVHGHGGELKEAAARLVAQLQLEPVILHEQSSGVGRSLRSFPRMRRKRALHLFYSPPMMWMRREPWRGTLICRLAPDKKSSLNSGSFLARWVAGEFALFTQLGRNAFRLRWNSLCAV